MKLFILLSHERIIFTSYFRKRAHFYFNLIWQRRQIRDSNLCRSEPLALHPMCVKNFVLPVGHTLL